MTREERQRNLERKRVRMEVEKAMGGKERKGVGKRDSSSKGGGGFHFAE